jgi:uncharacterized glyoxalase superfamily protein PhnB
VTQQRAVHCGSECKSRSKKLGFRSNDLSWWGIFYVSDVDAFYANAVAEGYTPDTAPRDAEWGERFFHITDPDGHELSFARVLV